MDTNTKQRQKLDEYLAERGDDLSPSGTLDASDPVRTIIEQEAARIVETLRPLDPGSWETNNLYVREVLREVLRRFSAALAAVETPQEVCLGCGKPTTERDCGCPAGTGWRKKAATHTFTE